MAGITTILTSTYAKPLLLREAGDSLLAQTRSDWRWWLVLDGPCPETEAVARSFLDDPRVTLLYENCGVWERRKFYRPARHLNTYWPKVCTDYLGWLSDDDLLDPCFVETLAGALDADSSRDVVYGRCEVQRVDGSTRNWLPGSVRDFGPGRVSPDCQLDGGQVLFTRRILCALAGWTIPEDNTSSAHCDGLFLSRLAEYTPFHFVGRKVMTKRCMTISEHDRGYV